MGNQAAAYCKAHAEDGMVDVFSRRCSYTSCSSKPRFNVEGSKTPAYCGKHAVGGMVIVHRKHCSHNLCTRRRAWGMLNDGAATVCYRHKSDIMGGPVVNFRARCKVTGCRKESRWGFDGRQPTHCREHGPLEDGLECNVSAARRQASCSASNDAVRASSFHVKTEFLF